MNRDAQTLINSVRKEVEELDSNIARLIYKFGSELSVRKKVSTAVNKPSPHTPPRLGGPILT